MVVVPGEETDDTNETSDSDYLSFDESDAEETEEERKAREHERQLVLEAAGLIVKEDVKPPPRPPRPPRRSRSGSGHKRRPPPAAPRRASVISNTSFKDLPPIPEPDPIDHATRLDDAFDRYESFRSAHGDFNRLSVASMEAPPSPTASLTPSTTLTVSPSRDSNISTNETRGYSHLLHFLGRKTPQETERRTLTISAPMMINPPDGGTPRENSPAFGTVRI